MKYFFVPGRLETLSYAELLSQVNLLSRKSSIQKLENVFILDTDLSEALVTRMFNKLGGFTRFGSLIDDFDNFLDQFKSGKKVVYGISALGMRDNKKIKELLEQFKEHFKQQKISSRYLYNKNGFLSTFQIRKNAILEKGFELFIVKNSSGVMNGKTLGIQDIDLYSEIEYNKPFTDKQSGVLPAKLARILVNLSQVKEGETIWDPFCGSGTIPLMALIGGANVLCSDINGKAVGQTKGNITWLAERGLVGDLKYDTFEFDVLNPNSKIESELRKTDFEALVCEPYMGPPQYRAMSVPKANALLNEVAELYKSLFATLNHLKLTNFKAVIVFPSYKTPEGWVSMSINEIVGKKWQNENQKLGGDLHWRRSNSIIKRNIFVLSKKTKI